MAGLNPDPGSDSPARGSPSTGTGADTGGEAAARSTPAWWNQRYLNGDTPWDTGIVPPELQQLISTPGLPRGYALDLGCGTGLNSRYLAEHGFTVFGIDHAAPALARATAAAAGNICFCAGDVADLSFLRVQAVLALDVGCLHSLSPERRPAYAASLALHLVAGGLYLLYAFYPDPEASGAPGLAPADLAGFAPWFSLLWARHGWERGRRSAWYLLRRTRFLGTVS